ncbi:MAG TPA: response regulator [Kofleriaceae bacterium]|jgi:twitching motility two-component system response regulator PilH
MYTILVVDDVQTDRELIGMVMTRAGHRVAYAADGTEAIIKARELRPSLIFLDVVMPVQDGYKTCRLLKKDPDTTAIPVVMITSKNTESDRFWSQKQGAADHIGKPFTPDSLLDCLRLYAR